MTFIKYIILILLVSFILFPLPCFSTDSRGVQVVPVKKSNGDKASWGKYHALIIGINAYKEWPPLQTAVKDVTALRDILVERYGFFEKNVILRTNHEATEWQINTDIRNMASALEESDNLLIYFAGHGQLDGITGDGYWIPVEGKIKDSSTWISQDYIRRILCSERVKGKNIVVVADSCYSGSILRGGPSFLPLGDYGYQKKLKKAAARKSRQVITSGGVEPVADNGRDGHSLFAYYFIKALKENTRQFIDLENLFHTRVWEHVTEIGNQRPRIGRLKTPMDDGGQFVLVDNGTMIVKHKNQPKEQLFVSQSERDKLDAEKRFFEAQKKLLEEKKRIELERQQLEIEKQRIQKKQQEFTYIPDASVPNDSKYPFKLAILPWDLKIEIGVLYSIDFYFSIVVEALNDAIDKEILFHPSYSYYQLENKHATQPISEEILTKDIKKNLWSKKKKGPFSYLRPNTQLISDIGRQLGVDAVLIYKILIDKGDDTLEVFLIDVKNNQVYHCTGESYDFKMNDGYSGVYEMTRQIFLDFKKQDFKKSTIISQSLQISE